MNEQNQEFETRKKAFNAELIPLLDKYKLGLGAIPYYAQLESGQFGTLAQVHVFDVTKKLKAEGDSGITKE